MKIFINALLDDRAKAGYFLGDLALFFHLLFGGRALFYRTLRQTPWKIPLNAELTKKALEKVGNPNVLVNLISRRVRQLNSGSGRMSRPLVDEPATMGAADIALSEIIEEKIGYEMPQLVELTRPTSKKRGKRH